MVRLELPIRTFDNVSNFAQIGLELTEEVASSHMRYVNAPDGWSVTQEAVNGFTYALDGAGRKRVAIFAGAERSFMSLCPRYRQEVYFEDDKFSVRVVDADGERVVFETPLVKASVDKKDKAERRAAKWLQDKYPRHRDPVAYWS